MESSRPTPLRVKLNEQEIRISGDLDGSSLSLHALLRALGSTSLTGRVVVDASDATVVPEGVELWKNVVRHHLARCFLDYEDSQLACILKYDPTYDHCHSGYAED